ncbi:hypothetical protein FITA111629_01475 [Filibacter tadaridae]|uniref:Uncharacterized protein n=1 Tax=Filibacter tadaridae TaxID=2483811 RepID=A0A3P5X5R5_9BACL|nr:hypothetical protein [Filibacter tadaridae]VDC29549.1 hypothetical protein FILTAD_02142 [Filibacter tadaridae]
MSKKIVDKAKHILKGIQFDLELAFDWNKDHYDNYYQYFTHPDNEVRKWSLLIFAGGLGNWHLESAQIFRTIKELKKYSEFNKYKAYHFEDYVQSFLDNKDAIKQDFPLLYNQLVWYLLRLDNKKRCEYIFRTVDKQLLIELRQVLSESGIDASKFPNNHEDIMKEIGLTFKPV